ncbi:MAG: hypothetical protein JWP27_729 [Flaviaesturariibacter sp.]|nr:hypothetical protein [Flaviaesturariibacter sp.]
MIVKTRSSISEDRFYFLLWGWVSFAAIVTQFILKAIIGYPRHYLVWLVVIPAVIVTIIHSSRRGGNRSVSTYIGSSMASLWTGIGISFFILSLIVSRLPNGWLDAWPFFILFYGLGTYISGRILQFRPLVIGGMINWALAIASIYVAYDYQLLLAAAAILTSYIIPGHLLKRAAN